MKHLRPHLLLAIAWCTAAFAAVDPAQLDAARKLFTEKKYPDAQKSFETIVAGDAKCAEAHYYLAQLAQRRNDADAALAAAENAAMLVPDNADYQHLFGDAAGNSAQKASVFSQFGLAKKCVTAYERAVALAPNNLDFHQSLFEFYRQAPGIAGGGIDKALAEAATIKKIDAMRGRLCFATLYTIEKKYNQALAEFDEVLKDTPDDYAALYQVGKLAAVSGQHLDRGITSLKRCLELTPPTPNSPGPAAVHWRMGMIHENKKDPAAARAAYEASLKVDPKFPQALDALKKLK